MKRRVEFEGKVYAVKSDHVPIPNLDELERVAALIWLNRNTYRQGHSTKTPNPLQGLGDAINLTPH